MGVVYVAFDPQLDRKVALKILRSDVLSSAKRYEFQARMVREAQAMARLSHPNVVAVHDVGALGRLIFVAMDFIEGPTLGVWLKEKPRTWQEILKVLMGAGRGLAAAHAAGLVHRDFKPANVLVSSDGVAHVTDFGLVRTTSGDSIASRFTPKPGEGPTALDTELTPTGAFLGTPEYTAPEQIVGEISDARADQFSFSVAAYEALFGEHPFGGPTMAEVIHAISDGRVQPLERNAAVPAWVRKVLVRGLARRPEDRWPSMDALLDALSKDPRIRRARIAAVAGALALAGGAAAAVRVYYVHQEKTCRGASERLATVWDPERKRAIHDTFLATGVSFAEGSWAGVEKALDTHAAAWLGMRQDACEATRVRGEQSAEAMDLRMECLDQKLGEISALVDVLAAADAKVVQESVTAAHNLSSLDHCADVKGLRAVVRAPEEPGKAARLTEARRWTARSKELSDAGKYREAVSPAAQAVSAARESGYSPALAEALLVQAEVQSRLGDLPGARASAEEAAAAAQLGHDDLAAARAWSTLAFVLGYRQGHYEDGLWFTRLAEASVRRAGSNDEILADVRRCRGIVYGEQGRLDEAIAELTDAIELERKVHGDADPRVAGIANSLANEYNLRGDLDRALATHQQALDIETRLLDPKHPVIAIAVQNVGEDWAAKGEWAKAAEYHEKALALLKQAFGEEHAYVGATLANLGRDLGRLGEKARALEVEQRGVALLAKTEGPDSPMVAECLEYLGEIQLANGKPADALASYKRALSIREKSVPPDSGELTAALTGVGRTLLALGPPAPALAPLERAVQLRDAAKIRGTDLARARFRLAEALWATDGDHSRAVSLAEEALASMRKTPAARADAEECGKWLAAHRRR